MAEEGTGCVCNASQGRTAVCMWVGDRAFPHTSQPPIDSDPINQPQLTAHSLQCLPAHPPSSLLPALPGNMARVDGGIDGCLGGCSSAPGRYDSFAVGLDVVAERCR